MKYNKIPHTEIKVSKICLGTMTWGNQNSEKEAFEQLDLSVERGVNFIDTAELYPVPAEAETSGRTSEIIGKWLRKKKNRDKYIIATKVAGPGMEYIRNGTNLSKEHVAKAIETSLKRLNTDYIDLYQVHWPERKSNYFGQPVLILKAIYFL